MTVATRRHGSGPPPVMVVSEAARERETFKLESYSLADFKFNYGGGVLPSSEITTSKDSILTSLAQLGVYRTGTERAFVSLFDVRHQYILAEATPDTPLAPAVPSDDCATPIIQCGTAIPRNIGTCDHVLYVTNPGPDAGQPQDDTELPVSVIPDLTANPEFAWRPYCQFGEGGQFYAGVPIRSHRGVNIGTYCVFSSSKMRSWNDQSVRHMRDVSQAIGQHLEASRSKIAYRRSERLNRGLSSFVQGKASLCAWQSGPNQSPIDHGLSEGNLDTAQRRFEGCDPVNKAEELGCRADSAQLPADPPTVSRISEPSEGTAGATTLSLPELPVRGTSGDRITDDPSIMSDLAQPDTPGSDGRNGTDILYSNASNIIREAFEVPGCFFFDVTLGYYGVSNVQPQKRVSDQGPASLHSSASSSDEPSLATEEEKHDAVCDILGFSTTDVSGINPDRPDQTESVVPKRLLAKLLRRYPNGKIFNFDAVGELQSSDSSGDEVPSPSTPEHHNEGANGSTTTGERPVSVDRRFSRKREGDIIHRMFPNARSVAFMPVWDSKRERWLAGGFIYTLTSSRVFTIEGELSFFKAFANLMATEVQNLETLQIDKAKSDTLGSLSHELRSPLHGVILSTELLNDTDLSVFQGNATHTIETCCRTLLDTIDHLLDYSKVASFRAARKQNAMSSLSKPKRKTRSDQYDKSFKKFHSNLMLDGLLEEVVESIFAGYVFQHMSVRQLAERAKSAYADTVAHNRLDSLQAMEQLGPTLGRQSQKRLQFANVSVYLVVDADCDWKVYSQAGAIRRIIMNLVGNSLKYTSSGAVRITLSQEPQNPHSTKRNRGERLVKLTVQDTGKGISEDYLRHKLFKPFAQEEELAPGTGLGLSLVKKIVTQLNGQIRFESQVGHGTTVSVTLPLKHPSDSVELTEDDRDYEKHVKELKNLRIRLSGFESWSGLTGATTGRVIVEDTCRRSLHLDVIPDEQAHQLVPEVILWSEDSLPDEPGAIAQLSEAPNVVVCRDALVAYHRSTTCMSAGQDGIFEFVSQPISPRKLARAVHVAYKRWMRDHKPNTANHVRPFGPSRMYSSSSGIGMAKEPLTPQEVVHPRQHAYVDSPSMFPPKVAAPVQPEPSATEHKEEQSREELPPALEELKGDRVLIVDDNPINLKVLSAYMRKLTRPYEAAMNGKEAMEAYIRNPGQFAVILMDISMPVMDGLEATRRIRAYENKHQCSPVVILVLTGMATDDAHQEALASGVDVFLTKPVRLKALSEVLESLNVLSTLETTGV